ncbi:lipocalin-like domain-containing protein [Polaribacter sp. Hel1_85]|uniref:lipocalin-like domain-containing protein n=1 Tax=Polaribacter sp. Hel1_85 TaxID=1250005 RepID=UPI00052D6305|nr:lipocalin-like domain-containing protein [Polaribacter sp. Hel1_85]KGL63149.1 hypothetical protein PHEL85_0182 [Polaribacter sp. Hel1_85]
MKAIPKLQVPAIQIPQDQYAHKGALTEWWWHIGTLTEKMKETPDIKGFKPRQFGFEVNAANMYGIGLMQISIADVSKKKHHQSYEIIENCPASWAESDPSKPWSVKLPSSLNTIVPNTSISMSAPQSDPTNMNVIANFLDDNNVKCTINIKVNQVGPPLLVWGTGIRDIYPKEQNPIKQNNYYYSLTNLKASGTITIDGETIEVEGTTWMDHEYGAFPPSAKWILQDVQLDNGIQLTNSAPGDKVLTVGQPIVGNATVLLKDGTSIYIPSVVTPLSPKSYDGVDYFMEFELTINNEEYGIDTGLTIKALMDNQVFTNPNSAPIYEGIASCSGSYNGKPVKGDAWIEQNITKAASLSSYTGYYALEGAEPGAFLSIDTNQTGTVLESTGAEKVGVVLESAVTISYSMDGKKSVSHVFDHTYSFKYNTLIFPNGDKITFNRDFNNGTLINVSGNIAGKSITGSTPFNPVPLVNFAGNYHQFGSSNDGDIILSISEKGEVLYAFSTPGVLIEVQSYTYNPAMYVLKFNSPSPDSKPYTLMLGTAGPLGLACSIIGSGAPTYVFSCNESTQSV